MKKITKRDQHVMLWSLVLVVGFVFALLAWGTSANNITSKEGVLKISGMYGESIQHSEIESIELIDKKPATKWRTNGFGFGQWAKGYFKNSKGEKFKLLINSRQKPLILITKKGGNKIYYSAARSDNKMIFADLIKTLPNNAYNPSLP